MIFGVSQLWVLPREYRRVSRTVLTLLQAVVCDICWAVAYISDGSEDRIDLVLNMGVLDRLVQLAASSEPQLIAPSLRALGNIVTGDDRQTQVSTIISLSHARFLGSLFSGGNRSWRFANRPASGFDVGQIGFDSRRLLVVIEHLRW